MTTQIVARLKRGGFTRSGEPTEVFKALMEMLPYDKIYFVDMHPDGKGYSLREAGTLVLDFTPPEGVEISAPAASAPQEIVPQSLPQPPVPPTPYEEAGRVIPQLQQLANETPVFDNAFQFSKPKSQGELLKELGVVEPVKKLHTPKDAFAQDKTKPKKPRKASRKPAIEPDLESDTWDADLPTPPPGSGPGAIKTTGFRIATPEEAVVARLGSGKFNRIL